MVGPAFKTVRNLINSNSVIASGVFSYFSQNNTIYPCIIIESPEMNTFWKSFNNVSRGKKVEFVIMSMSDNLSQTDEMADDIERILLENKQVLSNSGLSTIMINHTNSEHPIINGKQIHAKQTTIQFTYIGDA